MRNLTSDAYPASIISKFLQPLLLVILLLLTPPVSLEANSRAGLARTDSHQEKGGKRKATPGPPLNADEKLETVAITLTPDGFEPAKLTLLSGKTLLVIRKHIGPHAAEFELRINGKDKIVHHVKMPENMLNWSEVVELRPGSYSLSVVDNESWVCRITVSAK